jgi:hypothetical protein
MPRNHRSRAERPGRWCVLADVAVAYFAKDWDKRSVGLDKTAMHLAARSRVDRKEIHNIVRAILLTYGLPALIVSASSRYRAPASDAQPFAFACGGGSLRVRERGKEPGKTEPPSPSSARPLQRLETAFRTQQDDGGRPYGHRWSFRLQAPERREGTPLLGRPFAAPLCPCGRSRSAAAVLSLFHRSSKRVGINTVFPLCFPDHPDPYCAALRC